MSTEALPPAEEDVPRTPARWRRVLRVALIVAGAAAMLVALLPTLASYLPTERIIEGKANAALAGRLEVDGLRVGWFRATSIRQIRLYETRNKGEEPILVLDGFRTEHGLLGTMLSSGRTGNIEVARLYIDVERRPNGAINLLAAMPPPSPAEEVVEEKPSAEPLVLDLDKLLPEINLPVSRLGIFVRELEIRYHDAALEPPLDVVCEDGSVSLEWPGNAESLTLAIDGTLASSGERQPLGIDLVVDSWIASGGTTLSASTTDLRIRFGPESNKALYILNVALLNNTAGVSTSLELGPLVELAGFLRPDMELPVQGGRISLMANGDFSLSDQLKASTRLAVEGVTATGYGKDNEPVAVPDIAIVGDAMLDRTTFAPTEFSVRSETDLFDLKATSLMEPDGASRGEVVFIVETERLLGLLRQTRFDQEIIPAVRGNLNLAGSVVYTTSGLREAEATLDWKGDSLDWRDTSIFPRVFRPRASRLDLEPTSFRLDAAAEPLDGGGYSASIVIDGDLLRLVASADIADTTPETAELQVDGDLGRLYTYLASNFDGLPVTSLEGRLSLQQSWRSLSAGNMTTGKVSIDRLLLRGDMLPSGIVEDSPVITWTARLEPAPLDVPRFDIRIESNFLDMNASGDYRATAAFALKSTTDFDLDALREYFLDVYLDPATAELSGRTKLDFNVSSSGNQDYRVFARLVPGSEFSASIMEGLLPLDQFEISADALVNMGDDALEADIDLLHLAVGEMAALDLSGVYTKQGTATRANIMSKISVDLAEATMTFATRIEEAGYLVEDIAGNISTELSVRAATESTPEGMRFPEPLSVSNTLRTDIESLHLVGGFGEVVVEGIADHRTQTVTMESPDPATMKLLDEGTLEIASLLYNAMAELGDIRLATRTDLAGTDKVALRIGEFSMAGPLIATETMEVQTPALSLDGNFTADMTNRVYTWKDVAFSVAETLALESTGSFDQAGRKMDVDLAGDITGMGDVYTVMMIAGDPAEVALDGTAELRANLAMDLAARDTEDPYPGWLRGGVDLSWKDWSATAGEQYMVNGLDGRIFLRSTGEKLELLLSGAVADYDIANARIPEGAKELNLGASAVVQRSGTLDVSQLSIAIPGLGMAAEASALLDDWNAALDRFRQRDAGKSMVSHLLDEPFQIGLAYRQDLEMLTGMTPMDALAGQYTATAGLRNDPLEALTLSLDQGAVGIAGGMPQQLSWKGIDGHIGFVKTWTADPGVPPDATGLSGSLFIDSIQSERPVPFTAVRRAILTPTIDGDRLLLKALVESLVGGPADLRFTVHPSIQNLDLSGEFSLTDIDGANIVPGLAERAFPKRTIDLFGSFTLPVAGQPSAQRLVDEFTMRFEITDIGKDLLRGYLKAMDTEGTNPGVQGALAALEFSQPAAVAITIRNGLLNFDLELLSPIGIRLQFPVLRRVRIASAVGAWLDPSMDQSLVMLRNIVALLSTENTDDLATEIEKWGDW